MTALVEHHREAIRRLCAQYRVRRLELFGSATGDRFDPAVSDLDFLVEYLPLEAGQHALCYFGLLAALEDLFGRPVDLVMTTAIKNPYFRRAIEQTRVLLYAA